MWSSILFDLTVRLGFRVAIAWDSLSSLSLFEASFSAYVFFVTFSSSSFCSSCSLSPPSSSSSLLSSSSIFSEVLSSCTAALCETLLSLAFASATFFFFWGGGALYSTSPLLELAWRLSSLSLPLLLSFLLSSSSELSDEEEESDSDPESLETSLESRPPFDTLEPLLSSDSLLQLSLNSASPSSDPSSSLSEAA